MSLPKKFEIHAKYNPASRHTATLNEAGTKYHIESRESLGNAYDAPVELSVRFVQEALDEGSWIMTKKLEEAAEREMVFPFTAINSSTEAELAEEETFVVRKSAIEEECFAEYPDGGRYHFKISTVKELVKDGIWIVKSIGEKAEENTGTGFWITPGAIKLNNVTITPPQAPESTTTSIGKLSIDVDTNAAVVAVERLASAYEALNIAMESCLALNEKLKGLV
jgi:hypothetical protein